MITNLFETDPGNEFHETQNMNRDYPKFKRQLCIQAGGNDCLTTDDEMIPFSIFKRH